MDLLLHIMVFPSAKVLKEIWLHFFGSLLVRTHASDRSIRVSAQCLRSLFPFLATSFSSCNSVTCATCSVFCNISNQLNINASNKWHIPYRYPAQAVHGTKYSRFLTCLQRMYSTEIMYFPEHTVILQTDTLILANCEISIVIFVGLHIFNRPVSCVLYVRGADLVHGGHGHHDDGAVRPLHALTADGAQAHN